jgi:hypothetical protein
VIIGRGGRAPGACGRQARADAVSSGPKHVSSARPTSTHDPRAEMRMLRMHMHGATKQHLCGVFGTQVLFSFPGQSCTSAFFFLPRVLSFLEPNRTDHPMTYSARPQMPYKLYHEEAPNE